MLNEYKEKIKAQEMNINKELIVTKRKSDCVSETDVQNNELNTKKLKSSDKLVISKDVRYMK